jgi:hypothetical protein
LFYLKNPQYHLNILTFQGKFANHVIIIKVLFTIYDHVHISVERLRHQHKTDAHMLKTAAILEAAYSCCDAVFKLVFEIISSK